MPNDLYVSLQYLSKTEVQRIGAGLRSDPRDESAGWFVRAYRNEGYEDIVKYVRVSPTRAASIAKAVDGTLPTAMLRNGAPVQRAVQAIQTELARTRAQRRATAERQLRDAQAALAAIDAEVVGNDVDGPSTI